MITIYLYKFGDLFIEFINKYWILLIKELVKNALVILNFDYYGFTEFRTSSAFHPHPHRPQHQDPLQKCHSTSSF